MMDSINYEGRTFRALSNSDSGEVSGETRFYYHQSGNVVWAEYSGGEIVRGSLIAIAEADGALTMCYQHLNSSGELMTGKCRSRPERLSDGRLRLHERWQWTSGDRSSGESILEEITRQKQP